MPARTSSKSERSGGSTLAKFGFRRDVLERVCFGDGAVDDGVFFRRQASQHDAEQADQVDDVRAQDVRGRFVFARDGQVERIDMVLGIERDIEIFAAGGFGHVLVFALRVDDDDLGVEHERAQDLQLCRNTICRSRILRR